MTQIRKAVPAEAEILTRIAHEAKRYWGYPEDWIEHWKDQLTITPDFIGANEVYLAISDDHVAGFYAIVEVGPRNRDASAPRKAELEHMWVKPEHIGTGIGKELLIHAIETATFLDAAALEISSDPNAEGFYKRMGAKRIGEITSEIEGQPRTLPHLSIDLTSQ
jgi:GNAT superfamily N-acetyltransferase